MTRILYELPPVWDAAVTKFKLDKMDDVKPVFAYAPFIYDPFCTDPPRCIIAHEEVHIKRQGNNPAAWWRQYLMSEDFRLAEEILAHLAEYKVLVKGVRGAAGRRDLIHSTAKRLCHPMYGYQPALPEHKAVALLRWAMRQ